MGAVACHTADYKSPYFMQEVIGCIHSCIVLMEKHVFLLVIS